MPDDRYKEMEGYIAKYGFQCLEKNLTRFEAERAFQLEPEPPKVEDINEYIVMANREHNLLYVCFYLHHIEKILNGRINRFFHKEGLYGYDPQRLLDYKLNCLAAIMECLPGYDPDKGADFLTYAYYDIGNAILNCPRYEEAGSSKIWTSTKPSGESRGSITKQAAPARKPLRRSCRKLDAPKKQRRTISERPAKIGVSFPSMIPFSTKVTKDSMKLSMRIPTRTPVKI